MFHKCKNKLFCANAFIFIICFCCVTAFANAKPLNPLRKLKEVTLKNGMHLLMLPRHSAPIIAGGWVVNVGSANEHKGITGMSHMFEHVMFKGSETIGTKDYNKEKGINAEVASLRKQRQLVGDGITQERLSSAIKKKQEELDKLYKKSEYFNIYAQHGGDRINAYTTRDHTAYFLTLPANKLELFMWMESDRLINPVFREFYTERDAVLAERKERMNKSPFIHASYQFEDKYWAGTPFSWPVIGTRNDIGGYTLAAARRYLQHYTPKNITLILVGDFDVDQAVTLANKYFSSFKRASDNSDNTGSVDQSDFRVKPVVGSYDIVAPASVTLRYPTDKIGGESYVPLQVLSYMLNSPVGELKQQLQLSNLASSAQSYNNVNRYAGYFSVYAEAYNNNDITKIENKIIDILQDYKHNVSQDRLQLAKTNLLYNYYSHLRSNYSILQYLLRYASYDNGMNYLKSYPDMIEAVSVADVKRAAQVFFSDDQSRMIVTKKSNDGGV